MPVAPRVLNSFEQTNRGSLLNIVITLDVQSFDYTPNGGKSSGLMLLMQFKQMIGKVSQHDIIENFIPILCAILIPAPLKRRARLQKKQNHLFLRNHGNFGMS